MAWERPPRPALTSGDVRVFIEETLRPNGVSAPPVLFELTPLGVEFTVSPDATYENRVGTFNGRAHIGMRGNERQVSVSQLMINDLIEQTPDLELDNDRADGYTWCLSDADLAVALAQLVGGYEIEAVDKIGRLARYAMALEAIKAAE